jgi:cellulose synthase/poly-beta-1,6-N-acetylglucosamine synthase-like glycosyltransferase
MRVCVLIAAKNEGIAIGSTIDSIVSAGIDKENVYLVSDGSTDDTALLGRSRGIQVLDLPVNGGKSLAIAKGIKYFNLASYDLLALADADTTFEPGYFAAMARAFEKVPNAAIACGKVKSRPKNWLTAWRALQYAVGHWLIKEGQHALGTINVAAGCCSVFRMSLFDQIWESRPSIVEDMMATLRAHDLGYDVIYVRDAVVITADPQDLLRSYSRQLTRWNGGAWSCTRQLKMWGSTRRIALETQLVMSEGFVVSILLLLLPLWLYLFPRTVATWLTIDGGFMLISAAVVSATQKRWDILFYMPTYLALRFVDSYLFLKGFHQAFLGPKSEKLSWQSSTRYKLN